jgi:N-acetylglucosaminyl-diphospho-decaprenol L-rhamnosyltransferase
MDAVVVTMNSGRRLEQLLACAELRAQFDRVIVVDNASSDDSAAVTIRGGGIRIAVERRAGYGACVNLGTLHTAGDCFAVLNPDILFTEPETVARLERHLDRPGVGLVAPSLTLPDGSIQDSARYIPTPYELLLRRWVQPKRGAIFESGVVPWVVGACFVVRREAWEAVGGFDERYPLYFEDVDLCWRLRKAGWRTYFDAYVKVRHEHGAASRASMLGAATRKHMISAARFYRSAPRFVLPVGRRERPA